MKKILLGIVFISFANLTYVSAQTAEQQKAGTAIISQLLGNQFQLNSDATKVLSQKEANSIVMVQQDIPQFARHGISTALNLDRTNPNWRGVFTALSTECGEIPVIVGGDGDGREPLVLVVLPPDNECTKLISALAPYIYSSKVSSTGDAQNCTSKLCVKVAQEGYQEVFACVDIITIISGEGVCVAVQDCSEDQPCTRGSGTSFRGVDIRDILFMNE